MRRRNQSEIDKATITFLAKRLPKVSNDAVISFLHNPFEHTVCFERAGKRALAKELLWCCDCGESFSRSELTDIHENPKYAKEPYYFVDRRYKATCPHCGKPMEISNSQYRNKKFEDIVGVHTFMGEWCIDRYFLSIAYCKAGEKQETYIVEIGQTWSREEGKEYHWFCPKGGFMYSKFWRTDAPWHFASYAPDCDTWCEIDEQYEYPSDFSVDAEIIKRGISLDSLHGLKLTQILQYMEKDCHFETLWKQGDWEIAKFFNKDLYAYWPSVRIARNHGYKIKNLIEWRDIINMLKYMDMDYRNPKYICPEDEHEMHQSLAGQRNAYIQTRNRKAERERDLQRLKDAIVQYGEEYTKRIAKYLDIDISDETLHIVVLPDIQAFYDEADHLCHCVFRSRYYLHTDSLILSARDSKGKRWETIEVNLNDFSIAQSYGYGDEFTTKHKQILNLVESNMWQIKQRFAMAS